MRTALAAGVAAWLTLAVGESTTSLGLGRADGHAVLDRAEPGVSSTQKVAPSRVRLWFTTAIEPAYSRVQVLDAAGKNVDAGDSVVDARDRTLLTTSLPAGLPVGRYTVRWRVLSVDTHVSQGNFTFRVAR